MQPKYEIFTAVLLNGGTRGYIRMSHRLFKINEATYTYSIMTEHGEVAHREERDVFIDRAAYP